MGNILSSLGLVAGISLFCSGCVSHDGPIRTQIVTYPDNGIVEYNGKQLGRAPASITLPQDENGRLTKRAVVRVFPKHAPHLVAETKIFEPGSEERIPNRVLIDLTGYNSTNSTPEQLAEARARVRQTRKPLKYTERSKPTQVVGIDREHMRDTD